MLSTLNLFKALPVVNKDPGVIDLEITAMTIQHGFVLAPEIYSNYTKTEVLNLVKLINSVLGFSSKQANSSFHKSWEKVCNASIEQLFVEQLVHYFTSYGLGLTGSSVYVPSEQLDLPISEGFHLTVIRGYTKEELKQKAMFLAESGMALAEVTLNDLLDVFKYVNITIHDIEQIQNKEMKIRLYEYFKVIPKDPVEFLRYIVFKSTGKTLLIKNFTSIAEIKNGNSEDIARMFKRYNEEVGFKRLAEIFYRFKPLFLAFKSTAQLCKYINKIRKLAVEHHTPMKEDYLNNVTARIANNMLDTNRLKKELSNCNVFRKIRLAYALKYRTIDAESILYKIRNGKGFASDFGFYNKNKAAGALEIVLDSITQNLNVQDLKIYLPNYVDYALPATEKQFTGVFPSGTCVTIPKDMVFGVHWYNVQGQTDLDLSLIGLGVKYGWDANYRNNERSILFSGDMTDAQNGASELFYIKRQEDSAHLVVLNYYNFREERDIPFTIFVAHEEIKNMRENYIVNPNNIVISTKTEINTRQQILGIVVVDKNESKFYFSQTDIGNSITVVGSKYIENSRNYLFNYYTNSINLREVLTAAGAKFVDKEFCDIDLSPENLEKDTIIKLLNR